MPAHALAVLHLDDDQRVRRKPVRVRAPEIRSIAILAVCDGTRDERKDKADGDNSHGHRVLSF
jgi:hypothetical protein